MGDEMINVSPWAVFHIGHFAWHQRALLPGDFAPGRKVAAWHIVYPDGKVAHPYDSPKCSTCGVTPETSELEVVEKSTGERMFLAPYRALQRPWPQPKNPKNCWWCNLPAPPGRPPLCDSCVEHLRRY
jgi:hypothetical protein